MATNPEVLLISSVIRQQDYLTPMANGITTAFFHAYEDEWQWIESYTSRHHRTPSREAFLNKFPNFTIKKADDVAHFCDEVRSAHASAEMSTMIQDALDIMKTGDIKHAIRLMHAKSIEIEARVDGMAHDADIIGNYGDVLREVERRAERAAQFGMAGIPTGFPTLDERTGGPGPGHVWVVAARLGQGKTWSLVRMAVAACFSGFTIQYDALEQSRAEIAMRVHTFMSSEFGKQVFKNLDLAQGRNFDMREYREFLSNMSNEIQGKFYVADTTRGRVSPTTIAAQIERNKPDAVFLDYLTLMESGNSEDWRGVAKLSASLKQVATQYQVPIIAAAQLNRSAAGGREMAGPEALAESDAIGRDADAVITMRQISKRVIKMRLAKFRHGRDGFDWYTTFTPNTGHFEEVTLDQAKDIEAEDRDMEEEDNPSFKPRQRGSYAASAQARQDRRNGDSNNNAIRKIVRKKSTST